MLKYIWSSLLLLIPITSFAADSAKVVSACWYKGFFVDFDVVEPAVSIFSDEHQGANASVSINLKDVFFPTLLVGYSKYDATDDYSSYEIQPADYSYSVKGPYFKIGADFNLLKSTKRFKPECYLGARYAFSSYNYDISNVALAGMSKSHYLTRSGTTFAQWGEFVGGVRVPVYKRLYLSLEGNYKWRFSPRKDEFSNADGTNTVINQSYAPGFGDSNGTTWGFRYMISFFF